MKTKLYIIIIFLIAACAVKESKAQMYWNHALAITGSSDSYMSFPTNTAVNLTGSFTLEAWVKPAEVNGVRPIIGKNSSGSYGITLASGRAAIYTNNSYRLVSKATTVLQINKWTHIAGVYNSSNSKFEIYINGVLDTSATVNSAAPPSGTDSLYIGKLGPTTFSGTLDEMRIWNKTLTEAQIKRNYRTSLATSSSAAYSGLVFSLTFQERQIPNFYAYDWAGNCGLGNLRGQAGIVTLTNKLSNTISYNEALELDGVGDYAATVASTNTNVTGAFTMEAWVYVMEPSQNGQHQSVIRYGSTLNGYSMVVNNSNWFVVAVNGVGAGPDPQFPIKKWTHMAFTLSASGQGKFYLNGDSVFSTTYPVAAITGDSLYIGKTPNGDYFKGYIDEVRISKYEKTAKEIKDNLYTSINKSNDPSGYSDLVFSLDGSTYSNCDGSNELRLLGDAKFSAPNTIDFTPVSPLLRSDARNFSKGFSIKKSDRRIPETGTLGLMKQDSLMINDARNITDLNLFVAINHTFDADMEITLFAPNGDSVNVTLDHSFTTDRTGELITIFDDNADSTMVNGSYTSYAPYIKPESSLNNMFSGDAAQGVWRLKIYDDANGDTGRVYAWGLQINNDVVSVKQVSNLVPVKFELSQNYPNPFNPMTNIKFELPKSGMVKLKVYDILGKEVASLVNEIKSAGVYIVDFNAAHLSSGAYFYKLETDGFTDIKKMMLIK